MKNVDKILKTWNKEEKSKNLMRISSESNIWNGDGLKHWAIGTSGDTSKFIRTFIWCFSFIRTPSIRDAFFCFSFVSPQNIKENFSRFQHSDSVTVLFRKFENIPCNFNVKSFICSPLTPKENVIGIKRSGNTATKQRFRDEIWIVVKWCFACLFGSTMLIWNASTALLWNC